MIANTPKSNSVANLPVTALSGVGKGIADKLAQLGIYRLFDLVMHLPRDYEDRSRVLPIGQVVHGASCLVAGVVTAIDKHRGAMRVTLSDDTGSLSLQFFKVWQALEQMMAVGSHLTAFGEIKVSRFGVQMAHPEYYLTGTRTLEVGLSPVYPSVKGLHQNKLRQLIRLALNALTQGLFCVPDTIYAQFALPDLWQSKDASENALLQVLTAIHLPAADVDIASQTMTLQALKARTHPACRRLIIEELTAHQLGFLFRRKNLYRHKAPKCVPQSSLATGLLTNLSFDLTKAQKRVIDEIVHDMTGVHPMLRLVQGDVGAGKTLVAAMAACHALDGGWQVAVMAPTEILAEQHLFNFTKWLEPLGVRVGWLVGKQSVKERNQTLVQILNNNIQVVIGTHALFQDGVSFAKLGLVVIDEQHRFGVEQRLRLANKGVMGKTPHQLAMTATPIPRTLAMSLYGDMAVSVIDELPPNRTPITTAVINRERRDELLERVRINCKSGKQAYWVCPLVEESVVMDAQSAQLMYADIAGRLDIRVGLVHGKMKSSDKQQTMQAFKDGQLDLLVATTVIEVGVDVPNASLMVIENAERLGLSQLHQLRGRVGRGSQKSFCVLLYQLPLSETGIERLNILKESSDGFVIAQKDLALRGAGELLGKRQTGDMGYYISDIVRDESLLMSAQALAEVLADDVRYRPICDAIMQLWIPQIKDYIHA